ncbi:RNA-directed DNA polymerase (fragment) [Vibrio nigripulchritudo SOn1]|uniref:RNA-directed DNA polymerase n=1 Tax=Vibrio nigripulchritudo SOn1 TaxID=1238450 RepID=A0AAV2W0F4_9VIBR
MLLALTGLEMLVKEVAKKSGERVNFVGYADDFVITGSSKDVLVNEVKPRLIDFLGFNLRKYKGKLLIKPSKTNVLSFLGNLRELIKKHATMPVNDLIRLTNPILKGWANYYSHCVAKRTFGYLGHQIFWLLWRWTVRHHPTKPKDWVRRKYCMNISGG